LIDKEKILGLSFAEVRELIIDVLKNRPANSVKKDSLSTEILRRLGVDIRREARKKFEYRVLRAVEVLKKKGIIKEYKSKNVRLKLNDIHEFSLFKKPNLDPPLTQAGEATLERDHDEEDFDTEIRIPDFPDEITEDENADDDEVDLTSGEKYVDGITDPEMERLLKIFLDANRTDTEPSGRDNPNVGQYSNLLQEIKEYFDKDVRVQAQLAPNRIALIVKTNSGKIVLLINLDEVRGEAAISSIIPYLEDANLDVVRLCSTCHFMGSLSVEESQGQLYFSVKDALLISKVDRVGIIKRIEEMISESIKIDEIIDRYL
jgi:hypothetical protein